MRYELRAHSMKPKKLSDTTVPGTTEPEELRRRYDNWATNARVRMRWEYVAHKSAARKLWKHFTDNDVRLLCFGNTADIAKQALSEKGFMQIDALNNADDLIDIAKNSYDAVVSIGTFINNDADPLLFPELARITKPNGLVVFTLQAQAEEEAALLDKANDLEARENWKLVESFGGRYLKDAEGMSILYIYKKL